MKCLLFGILREQESAPALTWAEGQDVSFVSERGLAAAFSWLPSAIERPDISRLVAYGRVIEVLFQTDAILPMRFGCFLDGAPQIQELLQRRSHEFRASLDEVDGCAEMSIRILLSDRSAAKDRQAPVVYGAVSATASNNKGLAYLAERKTHFARVEQRLKQSVDVGQEIETFFAGLFKRCKVDQPPITEHLMAVHFLLPRNHLESFRRMFANLQKTSPHRLLLTGPWPPYSFVECLLPACSSRGQG